MIEICRRRTFAAISAGLLFPSCAPQAPSTLTIIGPADEVKKFVAAERARAGVVKVFYEEGAREATFEPSSGEESAGLIERAILKELTVSFKASD